MKLKTILGIKQNEMSKGIYEYHTLPNAFKSRTIWKPIIAILICIIFYLILQTILFLISYVALNFYKTYTISQYLQLFTGKTTLNLSIIFVLFSSVALLLPSLFLSMWIMRMNPIRMISSVALHLRWKFMTKIAIYATVISILMHVFIGIITGTLNDISLPEKTYDIKYWIGFIIVIFFIIPLQSAAEEYVFRGFLMQTLGNWFRSSIISIGVTSILFAFAHTYNSWAFLDVLIFGITNGYLTYKTGGLEAAIAIHSANNIISVLQTFLTTQTFDPQASGSSNDLLFTLIQLITLILITLYLCNKNNIKRTYTISDKANEIKNIENKTKEKYFEPEKNEKIIENKEFKQTQEIFCCKKNK